jgi:hypothetical protein
VLKRNLVPENGDVEIQVEQNDNQCYQYEVKRVFLHCLPVEVKAIKLLNILKVTTSKWIIL